MGGENREDGNVQLEQGESESYDRMGIKGRNVLDDSRQGCKVRDEPKERKRGINKRTRRGMFWGVGYGTLLVVVRVHLERRS
jgi:hypothetical protein